MASLLPKTRDEFGQAAFWDKFNAETEEFEWYGSFSQLQVCKRYITPSSRVLVIGCGNSNFSAELYDSGVENITNVDFDEKVILDMTLRNIKRPSMKWEVMDMRNLNFNGELFDVVFDKGALDALMSSPESKQIATEMVDSISNVLTPDGTYVCVSLSQEFIFSHLAESVSKYFDSLDVHILKEASGNSSHVPFLFSLMRNSKNFEKATNNKQQKTNKKTTCHCYFDDELNILTASPKGISSDKCWKCIHQAQDDFKMKKILRDLKELKLDRLEQIELWAPTVNQPSAAAPAAITESNDGRAEIKSKYTLSVLDAKQPLKKSQNKQSQDDISVAAFIVPQGREHEFLFSSKEGLKQIADSANCCRLLSIALNRGHDFESLEQIKQELSQTVLDFSPHGFNGRIPFLTTEEGTGKRNAISSGKLDSGDEYIVEETEIEGIVVRRLVFMTNTNVIQTEVKLLSSHQSTHNKDDDDWGVSSVMKQTSNLSKKKNKSKKQNGKKNKNKKMSSSDQQNNIDINDNTAEEEMPSVLMDYSYMCFDYHRAIIAGILSLLTSTASSQACGVVIGLGGGALPMMLHHFFPLAPLVVAELDHQVYNVAKQWFGFREDDLMKVVLTDGLVLDMGKKSYVVIDVDSKDPSVGMSCPPMSFLSEIYLSRVKASLLPGGLLVVNVAARSTNMYNIAIGAIHKVFHNSSIFILKASDDDANTVVFACNDQIASPMEEQMNNKSNILQVLKNIPDQTNDPLGLAELSSDMKKVML